MISVTMLNGTDWIPAFEDKPLSPEQVIAIEGALPDEPIAKPGKERRVLVYSATQGYRHESIVSGKVALQRMGEATGAYTCLISDDPANFEPGALMAYDAVILLSPTEDMFMPNQSLKGGFSSAEWKELQARQKRLTDNLVAYVRAGGGLMGIHSATDACYNHKDYGDVIGGYFWGHPWRANNNVTIVVEDPGHATIKPVFEGIADFRLVEEIYQFREEPYSRDKVRVLLHLDPKRSDEVRGMKRKDNDYPVAWVQQVGNGRVFYTSLGHNHHIYANPLILKHYLAGIQFAVGDLHADMTPSSQVGK